MSYPLVDLGSVVELQAGIGFPTRLQGKKSGEFPFAKVGDISRNGRTGNPTLKIVDNFIDQSDVESLRAKTIPTGSILFAKIGEAIRQNHRVIAHQNLLIDNNAMAAIPSEKIDNLYLYYFLKQVDFYRLAPATTVPALRKSDLQKIQIPLPPLSEQRRIASILDKADELRQKRQQAIEKLDRLLQATFIDMFGDPVSNPKGWPVKKLKDLSIKIHSGNTPKGGSENYVDEGIIFLRSQNIWKNKIILDDVAYIDVETHAKMLKSSVKHEDILMTKTGRINTDNSSLGRAAIYLGADDSANINGHVYLIRIKKEFNKYFILNILTLPDYYEYIRSVCVGGIDKRQLNKEHLENFPIMSPPSELQQKYSEIVKVIEKQKPILYKQLEIQENLFKALQNKAFSGTL